jgi:short-subunit dehydrogenase
MKKPPKKARPAPRKKPSRAPRARPTALVTGASSGIGKELAKVFAANGFDLVVVARRRAPLDALAAELASTHGARVTVLPEDLLDPLAPKRIHSALARRGIAVEVLVNNAGVVVVEDFVKNSVDVQLDLIRLNVLALTALARFFIPGMVAVYGASKAFVLSLSESLAIELEGTGVTVTALCPGFTETPLVKNAEKRLHKSFVPDLFMLDAASVAREGYDACMAGTPVCINGLSYEMVISWERMQPRWLVRRLGSFLSRRFRDAPVE